MMGPRRVDQAALFYEFSLERHVPRATHLLRSIDCFVDLSDVGATWPHSTARIGDPSRIRTGRGFPQKSAVFRYSKPPIPTRIPTSPRRWLRTVAVVVGSHVICRRHFTAREPPTKWSRRFFDPIPLPGGGELVTLPDTGHCAG
jgi:hypothetical protein